MGILAVQSNLELAQTAINTYLAQYIYVGVPEDMFCSAIDPWNRRGPFQLVINILQKKGVHFPSPLSFFPGIQSVCCMFTYSRVVICSQQCSQNLSNLLSVPDLLLSSLYHLSPLLSLSFPLFLELSLAHSLCPHPSGIWRYKEAWGGYGGAVGVLEKGLWQSRGMGGGGAVLRPTPNTEVIIALWH